VKPGRHWVVFGLLALFSLVLVWRLYYWQVLEHSWLSGQANAEHQRDELIPASRGDILDATGNVLVTNEAVNSVYVSRTQVKDPPRAASILSPLLHISASTLLQRMTNPKEQFIRLALWVSPAVSQQIRATKLAGIILEPTTHRVYPQATLAAQLLGFVNADNNGQYGLEEAYNTVLAGRPGHLQANVDMAGNPITYSLPQGSMPAQDGATLITSIDSGLQYVAEQELEAAVQKHRATGGSILILDPKTGDILADANFPSFDPNSYATADPASFANASIGQIYEPGSTFKIITMASALAQHTVTPQTTIQDYGELNIGGIHISNWNKQGHANENMIQLLQYSSNVGAATVAWRMGKDLYYPYLHSFGLGQKTGVDLAGEVDGQVVWPENPAWSPANLVTNAFGQGIAVTPLQLVAAVGAVANHGLLMKPRVVTAIRDASGDHVITPTQVRQVIPPTVASTLTQMLVDSAKDGEAQLAEVPGYAIAAKTGTAQIASPSGGYLPHTFIASLVGFAPAQDPRFVMLVKIDRPGDVPFGSEVAAPVWSDIARQIFVRYQIQPTDPAALAKAAATAAPPVPQPAKPEPVRRPPVHTAAPAAPTAHAVATSAVRAAVHPLATATPAHTTAPPTTVHPSQAPVARHVTSGAIATASHPA